MPNPTAATVANAAAAAAQANALANPRTLDPTYVREIRKYKEWVHKNIGEDVPVTLTRENVDCYFNLEIVKREINPESAKRALNALQRLADDVEHVGNANGFTVRSPLVAKALTTHATIYRAKQANNSRDDHTGLPTNMLSQEDKNQILDHVLSTNALNWEDLIMSMTGCEQMMVRVDSMRHYVLLDLVHNDTHVARPWSVTPEGPHDKDMISIVNRKGSHKVSVPRSSTTMHQVSHTKRFYRFHSSTTELLDAGPTRNICSVSPAPFPWCFSTGITQQAILTSRGRIYQSTPGGRTSLLSRTGIPQMPLWQRTRWFSIDWVFRGTSVPT
jgi:hypothetical protein